MKAIASLLGLLYFSLNSWAIPHKGDAPEEVIAESHAVVVAIDQDHAIEVSHWLSAGHSPFTRIKNKLKERLLDRAMVHGSLEVFSVLMKKVAGQKEKVKLVDFRGTPMLVTLAALSLPNRAESAKFESMLNLALGLPSLDVNEKDKAYIGDGRTALHQACANGNLKVAKALIARGAGVNVKSSSGETPLHLAARGGHLDVVQTLLAAKAKVNERTFFTKATPLVAAAETGQASVIRLLMASGAKKEEKDTFGKTAPERYKEYRRVVGQRPEASSGIATQPEKR